MTKFTKLRLPFLLAIVIIAMTLLSTGLSAVEPGPGHPLPPGAWVDTQPTGSPDASRPGFPTLLVPWWGILTGCIFLSLIALWILTFILRPQARKGMLTRMLSYLVLLLLIYGLFNALQKPPGTNEENVSNSFPAEPAEAPVPDDELPPPAFIANPPQWFIITVTATLLTLLLSAGWFIWGRRPQSREQPAALLADEARQAIEALQTGRDLKDAVMDCYAKMNRVLSEQRGIHRQKTMTPREFETHLAEIGLSDAHIRRLTRLFEGVRYGAAAPGRREEREAIACLNAIVTAYGRSS